MWARMDLTKSACWCEPPLSNQLSPPKDTGLAWINGGLTNGGFFEYFMICPLNMSKNGKRVPKGALIQNKQHLKPTRRSLPRCRDISMCQTLGRLLNRDSSKPHPELSALRRPSQTSPDGSCCQYGRRRRCQESGQSLALGSAMWGLIKRSHKHGVKSKRNHQKKYDSWEK